MAGIRTMIRGAGYFVPERIVDNDQIVARINTTREFIEQRTGVLTRHHAEAHQSLRDLIVPAAQKALAHAQVKASDIDLLLVNTLSPDYHDPSEACLIQPLLGLGNVPAFDIRAQCTGLIYGMHIAQQFIENGTYQNILVVCGEMLSKRMDVSDEGRNLAILLGDGAGALVLSARQDTEKGIVDIITKADGDYFRLLWTESPGSANERFEGDDDSCPFFRMNGKPMFEHASASLMSIATEILEKNHLTLDDIDVVIPHQPNMRILDAVMEGLQIPREKMVLNVHFLGNMASASLPVTLAMAYEEGYVQEGMLGLFLGYGSGATWGACLYQF